MKKLFSPSLQTHDRTKPAKIRPRTWLWLGLFLILLTCMRLIWVHHFTTPEYRQIMDGQLDLRGAEFVNDSVVSLDGQWTFYPYTWLMDEQSARNSSMPADGKLLQVPGGWNAFMQPGESSSYGYGSYHLRMVTDPGDHTTYSIYVPSVRSASQLFVNGRLLAQSGVPAAHKHDYTPKNAPYTVAFTADDDGIIDIIVQAANYDDSRKGGIIRSMRFGTEHAVAKEIRLSTTMNELILIALLFHALYALIVYGIGSRDVRLLHFAVLIVCLLYNVATSGDKLLLSWLPLPLIWDFKLKFMSILIGIYALLQCVRPKQPGRWRSFVFYSYTAFTVFGSIAIILLPVASMQSIMWIIYIVIGISMLVSIYHLARSARTKSRNRLYLLIAGIVFSHHMIWEYFMIGNGVKVIFYPFDLLIAIFAFSSVWIHRYFLTFTEMKRLADKLQLEDARKDEFLANTSHELRNPLHGILNISQNVMERERDLLDSRSVNDLEMVQAIGRRMSYMLSDFIDSVRLKERAVSLQIGSVSLHESITHVFSMLQYMTEGKPVRLTSDVADSFPYVEADGNRLIQILFNLVHNALKYTNEGEVAVRAFVEGEDALVLVEDTGVGMDEEALQRIFEPYEQADPSRNAGVGGFGLGLSICKQLVDLHGSKLEVHSLQGQGTSFGFRLPLARTSKVSQEAASPAAASAAVPLKAIHTRTDSADQPERIAILAVDDDHVNLHALAGMLAPEGRYDIAYAYSGTEALHMLDAGAWDLVIADITMPHMSGLTLTQRIREKFDVYQLPILLLTARTHPEDIEAGFLAGASDYVTKPVNAIELRARVKALTKFKQSVSDRLQLEAAWLQAQIKPHFILNTLNAVASLSEEDSDKMRALILEFSDYLRASFDFRNSDQVVPLQQELNLVRSYLNVQLERFGDRLHIVWEIDDDIPMDLEIPPLSLQPLVENALVHGILQRSRGGKLCVRVMNLDHCIHFQVEDDGGGIEEQHINQMLSSHTLENKGIGLRNTNLRLKRLYGAGLQFDRVPGQHMRVSFDVPKKTQRKLV